MIHFSKTFWALKMAAHFPQTFKDRRNTVYTYAERYVEHFTLTSEDIKRYDDVERFTATLCSEKLVTSHNVSLRI